MNAQTKISNWSINLHSDFLSFPLTQGSVGLKNSGIALKFRTSEKITTSVGLDGLFLYQTEGEHYQNKSAFSLSASYLAAENSSFQLRCLSSFSTITLWELSYGNSLFKSSFVETGIRYFVMEEPTWSSNFNLGVYVKIGMCMNFKSK